MKLFKDNTGQEWSVKVDINALRRVQDLVGVNFADLKTLMDVLRRLRADDLFVADVAWALCHPQCTERKITREQFNDRLGGDITGAAYTAIMGEFGPDFFRDPEARALVSLVIGEIEKWWKRVSTSGSKSTTSPASSELIPAPSLSVNS